MTPELSCGSTLASYSRMKSPKVASVMRKLFGEPRTDRPTISCPATANVALPPRTLHPASERSGVSECQSGPAAGVIGATAKNTAAEAPMNTVLKCIVMVDPMTRRCASLPRLGQCSRSGLNRDPHLEMPAALPRRNLTPRLRVLRILTGIYRCSGKARDSVCARGVMNHDPNENESAARLVCDRLSVCELRDAARHQHAASGRSGRIRTAAGDSGPGGVAREGLVPRLREPGARQPRRAGTAEQLRSCGRRRAYPPGRC